MRLSRRGSILIVALASLMGLLGQTGALAVSPGTFVGTGTFAPGLLTSLCQAQTSVTFDSAVLEYVSTSPPTVSVTSQVHFEGVSYGCETTLSGSGHGTLSGGLAGSVGYVRIGNLATLSGSINGGAVFAGACILVPTTVDPVTSAAWYCVWVTD